MFYPKLIKDLMVKVFTGAGANVYQNQTPRKKRIAILGHIMYFMHNKPLFFFFRESFGSVLDNVFYMPTENDLNRTL